MHIEVGPDRERFIFTAEANRNTVRLEADRDHLKAKCPDFVLNCPHFICENPETVKYSLQLKIQMGLCMHTHAHTDRTRGIHILTADHLL